MWVSNTNVRYLRALIFSLLICLFAGGVWADAAGDLFNRADTAYSRRDYSEALALYQRVVNEYPANRLAATSLYYVGRCQEELGNFTAARSAYQNVIDRYGSSSMTEYARRRIREIDARQGAGGAVDRLASALEAATPAGGTLAPTPATRPAPVVSSVAPVPSGGWRPAESQGSGQVRTVNGRREYIVIPGDTLSGIAGSLLGDESKFRLIAQANGISAPYTIYAGQVLVIPDASGRVSSGTTEPTESFPEVDEAVPSQSGSASSFPSLSGLPSVSVSPQGRQGASPSAAFPEIASMETQQRPASTVASVSLPRPAGASLPAQQAPTQSAASAVAAPTPSQVVIMTPQVIPTATPRPAPEASSAANMRPGVVEPITPAAPSFTPTAQRAGVAPSSEPMEYVSGEFGRMGGVDLPFEVNVTQEVISQSAATTRYTPPNIQPFQPFTPTIEPAARSRQQPSSFPGVTSPRPVNLGRGPQTIPQTVGTGPRIEVAAGTLPDGAQLMERRRFIDAHNARAAQYIQLGLFGEAVSEYESIINTAPEDPVAYNNLAWLLVEEDIDYDRAVELIQTALVLEPPSKGAYLDTLAWAYYRKGELQSASETILKSLADQETAIRLYHAGVIYAELGLRSRARGYLEKAIAFSEDANLARAARTVRDSLNN